MRKYKTYLIIAIMLMGFATYNFAQNVNDPAPDFSLNDMNGESFTLSEQQGKVVFIFLFGWNCPHCKANGPNTQSDIYEKYSSNENFVAIGIETWDGNKSSTQSFINTTGIEYPVLLYGSNILTKYKTTYDRIIVIDKDGDIKYKSTDVANKTVTAEASNIISSLLSSTTDIADRNSESEQLLIAPNPIVDNLSFKLPQGQNKSAKVNIYNKQGQIIFTTDMRIKEHNTIDAAHLADGIYHLQVITDTNTFSASFIK